MQGCIHTRMQRRQHLSSARVAVLAGAGDRAFQVRLVLVREALLGLGVVERDRAALLLGARRHDTHDVVEPQLQDAGLDDVF